MQASAAKDTMLDKALELGDEQFEQMCKMLIERAEQTRELELTPFRGDGGIDIHTIIDRELFYVRLGVQTKKYSPGNTVGVRSLRSFKGALSDNDYQIGTYITTSSYTSGAIDSSERDYIRLIDGDTLTAIMLEGQIGIVQESDARYSVDNEFWDVFRQPEDTDIIPTLEVPQADNFEILSLVLQSIEMGGDMKPNIAEFVSDNLGESFDPRQADYYGIAGWLLGFIHKEKRVEVDGREVRRWGLTREGEEYVEYMRLGENQSANQMLYEGIRSVEIISRIYERLTDAGTLTRQEIADILAEETELSGSTTGRRARTVGQWLTELPEVRSSGSGVEEQYEYVRS